MRNIEEFQKDIVNTAITEAAGLIDQNQRDDLSQLALVEILEQCASIRDKAYKAPLKNVLHLQQQAAIIGQSTEK